MPFYTVDFTANLSRDVSMRGVVKANGLEEAIEKAYQLDMLDIEETEVVEEYITEVDEVEGFRIKSIKGDDYGIYYRTECITK